MGVCGGVVAREGVGVGVGPVFRGDSSALSRSLLSFPAPTKVPKPHNWHVVQPYNIIKRIGYTYL